MSTQVLKIKEQTWIKVVNVLLLFYFFNNFFGKFHGKSVKYSKDKEYKYPKNLKT